MSEEQAPLSSGEASKTVTHGSGFEPEFGELVEAFVEALPNRLSQMLRAYEKWDLDALRTLAHQLKGSGVGYGLYDLSSKCAELETHCRSSSIAKIRSSLCDLSHLIARLQAR